MLGDQSIIECIANWESFNARTIEAMQTIEPIYVCYENKEIQR